jgi:hypothetical protein
MPPSVATANRDTDTLWCVKLPNGDVRAMTLDTLEAAFHAGKVDESTPLLASGRTTWVPLGKLAGLDGEAPSATAPRGRRHGSFLTVALLALACVAITGDPSWRARMPVARPAVAARAQDRASDRDAVRSTAHSALASSLVSLDPSRGSSLASLDPSRASSPDAARASSPSSEAAIPDARAQRPLERDRRHERTLKKKRKRVRPHREPATVAPAGTGEVASQEQSAGSYPFHNGGDPHDPLNDQL